MHRKRLITGAELIMWVLVILAMPMTALVSWALWLGFNLLIAKWHGVDGLKATPAIAQAFPPRGLARCPLPGQVDSSITGGDIGA